jgi:SM-20-related protein
MPSAEFFSGLGVFVRPGFLDEDACAWLRAEARAARRVPGVVGVEADKFEIDSRSRSTDIAKVSSEAESLVFERLDVVTPEIEQHFSLKAEGRQPVQFLVYGEGDFFGAHRDRDDSDEAADFARARRVSIVTFLNGQSEEPAPEAFGGGELTFYGLLGEEPGSEVGLPIQAETGLLVAFDSELPHQVTAITHGQRYTVVTWLV